MEWLDQKPWNELGVNIRPTLSPSELVYKVKLDLETSWNPTGGVRPGRPKSLANQEMFQFFKSFTEYGETPLETIGTLDNGRIVWALAPLVDKFILKETDIVKCYLLLASRNEDRDKIELHFMMIRSVGGNTLQISSKANKLFKNICRRPFTKEFPFVSLKSHKFEEDMIKKTKEAVSLGRKAISAFASDAKILADKKIDDQIANQYMINVFQPDVVDEFGSINSKDLNRLADKNTKIGIEAIKKAPGQSLQSAQMTAWGLLNAVTYTVDHYLGSNQDIRLRMAWFGPSAKTKKRAFELALEL